MEGGKKGGRERERRGREEGKRKRRQGGSDKHLINVHQIAKKNDLISDIMFLLYLIFSFLVTNSSICIKKDLLQIGNTYFIAR